MNMFSGMKRTRLPTDSPIVGQGLDILDTAYEKINEREKLLLAMVCASMKAMGPAHVTAWSTLLARGLNTWDDAPEWLFQLADLLEGREHVKRTSARDQA